MINSFSKERGAGEYSDQKHRHCSARINIQAMFTLPNLSPEMQIQNSILNPKIWILDLLFLNLHVSFLIPIASFLNYAPHPPDNLELVNILQRAERLIDLEFLDSGAESHNPD